MNTVNEWVELTSEHKARAARSFGEGSVAVAPGPLPVRASECAVDDDYISEVLTDDDHISEVLAQGCRLVCTTPLTNILQRPLLVWHLDQVITDVHGQP